MISILTMETELMVILIPFSAYHVVFVYMCFLCVCLSCMCVSGVCVCALDVVEREVSSGLSYVYSEAIFRAEEQCTDIQAVNKQDIYYFF